jgi:hypothetical protein
MVDNQLCIYSLRAKERIVTLFGILRNGALILWAAALVGCGLLTRSSAPAKPAARAVASIPPGPPPTPGPQVLPPQANVSGDIPDSFAGTWLAVVYVNMSNLNNKPGLAPLAGNLTQTLRVTKANEGWQVETLETPAPQVLHAEESRAGSRPLVPSDETLRAATAGLASVKPIPPSYQRIMLFTPGHYTWPRPPRQAPDVKFSLYFVIHQKNIPVGATSYEFIKVGTDRLVGRYNSGMVLTAQKGGVVAPLGLRGEVTLYRLQ